MFRKRMSRATAQLTLIAVLWAASPGLTRAAVLGGTGHARPGTTLSSEGPFSHLLDWLASLSHGHFLPAKDQGIAIDPNDAPKPSAAVSCDQGSSVDPNGCPKPSHATYNSAGSGSAHTPNR